MEMLLDRPSLGVSKRILGEELSTTENKSNLHSIVNIGGSRQFCIYNVTKDLVSDPEQFSIYHYK